MANMIDMSMPMTVAPRSTGVVGDFTKGLVASSCLSAFQGSSGSVTPRHILRHGLQGGAALAAGAHAAKAIEHRNYGSALAGAAAGAVTVLLLEHLLGDGRS